MLRAAEGVLGVATDSRQGNVRSDRTDTKAQLDTTLCTAQRDPEKKRGVEREE